MDRYINALVGQPAQQQQDKFKNGLLSHRALMNYSNLALCADIYPVLEAVEYANRIKIVDSFKILAVEIVNSITCTRWIQMN